MSNEGARPTGSAAVRPVKTKKPWKGEKRSGPAPARHIPWPEVFKHHISVVEGHMKMLEMIQKHTVEGTPNFRTISDLVDRSREMLRHAKQQSHSFVPPPNYKDTVPLGSSSESMYPGYSPAHIQYGQAAQEVGSRIGTLRTEGREWKPPADAPEYQIGQGRGQKRKFYTKLDRQENTNGESSGLGNESAPAANGDATEDSEVPLFVVDTNPTPLVGSKRPAEETPDGAEKKKKKKAKGEEPAPVVETEDISAEVKANLKAKEKSKDKDGKRRRSSGGSDLETKSKKPKKEKKEKKKDKEGKRSAEADIEEATGNSDGEGKKKKRKKNKESE